MITLILTEKPSVAKDFARALGVRNRGDGYIEGEDVVITWAVGHLVELAEPGDYHVKWRRWSLSALPILPDELKYRPIQKGKKQLSVIRKQVGRRDVGRVVIATDAGREGEVIARTILGTIEERAEGSRPEVYRFWTSQALTPQVVRETMKKLEPASNFDRLWLAGRIRQSADWFVGMNLSRAATLSLGTCRETFSVGRVQTAVLALIVDRKRERERFKPEPYWVLKVRFENDKGTWWGTRFKKDENRLHTREEADRIALLATGNEGRIRSIRRSRKKVPPPPLYSLTDLQRDANSKFGLSAQQTLDVAQTLYDDRKCLSYPRTDSRVLGSSNVDLVARIVDRLSSSYPDLFSGLDRKRITAANRRVFNDAGLTDHHALIPLAPLPQKATSDEKRIYERVLKRFAAAFHPDYEFESTEIVTEVKEETFRTRGSRPILPGWRGVYGLKEFLGEDGDEDSEEVNLPPLEKNDPAKAEECRIEDRLTQPPPEYTEALLLKDMTNPSRYVTEEELQKIFKGEVGLGTQATRAQIIETLIARKYIARERKKLVATEKGCFLIEHLRRFESANAVTMPEETARWEMELEKIARGSGDAEAFITGIRVFVQSAVEEFKMMKKESSMVVFGKCPACGGEIIEGKKGYGCSNWKEENGGCRFVIWRQIAGRTLDSATVKTLLAGETTPALTFRSKEGKEFTASLRLDRKEQDGNWSTRFIFREKTEGDPGEEPSSSSELGRCPRCGGEVVEGSRGYGCSNWREQNGGCRFVIWKVIAGREIPEGAVRDLLDKGETEVIHGFISKKGREFAARLRLQEGDFKTVFVF